MLERRNRVEMKRRGEIQALSAAAPYLLELLPSYYGSCKRAAGRSSRVVSEVEEVEGRDRLLNLSKRPSWEKKLGRGTCASLYVIFR